MIEQKPEYITRQIRKLAREVGSLADNIDNHLERGPFYSELLKNKIFELYENNNHLLELLNQKATPTVNKSETTLIKEKEESRMHSVEKPQAEEIKEVPEIVAKEEVAKNIVAEKTLPAAENHFKEPEAEIQKEEIIEEVNPLKEIPEIEEKIDNEAQKEEAISEDIAENAEPETSKQALTVENTTTTFQPSIKKEETWLYNNMLDALEKTRKSGDIAEKKQDQPIKSLGNSISISQKHEFISALFAGESNLLKEAIQKIESMSNFDEAVVWMELNLANQYNWKKNEKLSFEFTNLVRRRFLQASA
jgi:hypothetical protein